MEEENKNIKLIDISDEVKTSFLDYAMSVIVSRAIPDVRDGMKPVHRRIIYAVADLGMTSDKPHKKSARIVGEVTAKYHPHSNEALYEAMVRMAQDFSYRYPLIDGHGNFGSIDGDSPAAMRYTEARLSKISNELVRDLNKNTVDFVDNYDGSEKEPTVLPSFFPNLLVNGASGIAVGMATNIPPHNLGEVIDGIIVLNNNPEITIVELLNHIKGPDFPTAALITGNGIKKAYETGNSTITIRSKVNIVKENNHTKFIVTEIPYQVNKSKLLERIAELVKEKIIIGISDLRDESNREGIRIIIELKKDAQEELILNKLYKMTPLQTNFSINFLALHKNQPKVLNIKQILQFYVDHQINVIVRKNQYDLEKSEAKLLILEGLIISLDNIDEVINIIRGSKTAQEASEKLETKYDLKSQQSKAILEMRLQRLTGLEKEKIENEIDELKKIIEQLKIILASKEKQIDTLNEILLEIKEKYNDPRRSKIIEEKLIEIDPESLIRKENVLVILTKDGYVKRILEDQFKLQNRGGKGVHVLNTDGTDQIHKIVSANTHQDLLIFSNLGKVYRIKVHQIENYSRHAKGIPIVNLIATSKNEKIQALLTVKNYCEDEYLFFVTKQGYIKKTASIEFQSIRQTGKIAIELKEDELVAVTTTNGKNEILIANNVGKVVRFEEQTVRPLNRHSMGVKGIANDKGNYVVGICSNLKSKTVLSLSTKGMGKKTFIDEYRLAGRGTKGVKSMNLTDKSGDLKTVLMVNETYELIIGTKNGKVIRLPINQIPLSKRTTIGARVVKLDQDDYINEVEIIENEHS